MGQVILVTGPTRSGKSEWAEHLATQTGLTVTYVATAQIDPHDSEWQARIQRHQQRRPATWQACSEPFDLTHLLDRADAQHCLLMDSLGTWIANHLDKNDSDWDTVQQELLASLCQSQAIAIIVAEETGWGVVPAYASGRLFRDRLGHLSRCIGHCADAIYLVVAGYAVNLKQIGLPVPASKSILFADTSQ